MELVTKAMIFAAQAHDGMKRKKDHTPYILHPTEVASIVGTLTNKQEVIVAALLHDVVEDTPATIEEIEQEFGSRVAELVQSETEDKRKGVSPASTWRARKEESIEILRNTTDPEVKMLFLGDKLSNMRSFYRQWQVEGISMWKGYHEKDPAQQAWYYHAIAESTKEFADTFAWKEYTFLMNAIFKEVEEVKEAKED